MSVVKLGKHTLPEPLFLSMNVRVEYSRTSITQLSNRFEVTAYRMGQALASLGIQKKNYLKQ